MRAGRAMRANSSVTNTMDGAPLFGPMVPRILVGGRTESKTVAVTTRTRTECGGRGYLFSGPQRSSTSTRTRDSELDSLVDKHALLYRNAITQALSLNPAEPIEVFGFGVFFMCFSVI